MRLPSYLKTVTTEVKNNKLYATIGFTRFPFELVIPNLIKIAGFRFWLYPTIIKGILKIKRAFKVTT